MPFQPTLPVATRLRLLENDTTPWTAQSAIQQMTSGVAGRVALISSFGAESVVLLHMISEIKPDLPVIFIDTEMLFPATLSYQKRVADELGLTQVIHVNPDRGDVFERDNEGLLHLADTDACCALRKSEPLTRALSGYDAWISGRKRHQGPSRAALKLWENESDLRLKVNPLFDWGRDQLRDYIADHNLPRHPLIDAGYPSIGCAPCAYKVTPGLDPRSGRWANSDKTECGIHLPVPTRNEGAKR